MVKVLILGVSGFVGRNVKEYLEQRNYEIYAPNHNELDCACEQDVKEYLEQNVYFDFVMNFAVNNNVEENLKIFLNFEKNSIYYGKMFYTGSGAEFDKRYDICMAREKDFGLRIPVDKYGLAKYTINKIIENSSNIYNLRLFGIYGKYEDYSYKFISNMCCKAIKDIPMSMRQNVYFDYLWIEDFCKMLELMLQREPRYHTYNIVSGKPVSLLEICNVINKISRKNLPIYICKDGLGMEYTASNERFISEYPEFEYTDMEVAISKLYGWYNCKENFNVYDLLYL